MTLTDVSTIWRNSHTTAAIVDIQIAFPSFSIPSTAFLDLGSGLELYQSGIAAISNATWNEDYDCR
jgi:hypothetical protein